MTIHGLGGMKIAYDSLPIELKAHMVSCLLRVLPVMNDQEVANTIHAFGQMACSWATASSALQASFQRAASAKLLTMQPQGLSNTLLGLAKMGAKWTFLLPELRNQAEQTAITIIKRIAHEQVVVNSIYSLGKMSAPWKSFSPAFRAAVLNAFVLVQDQLKPQGTSNFIYG